MRIPGLFFLRSGALTAALVASMLGAAAKDKSYAFSPIREPTKKPSDQSSSQPALTHDQMANFLRTAKIIGSKKGQKGLSQPARLTLSDGMLMHDASFQPINVFQPFQRFYDGTTETNFHDSYHYNIAAYEIAKLLGIGDMVPVTVERKWKNKTGSLSWWLPVMMDAADRYQKQIPAPDVDAWNNQLYKIRVFSELICDKDRNMTNILIGNDWKLYMIDFTRAFKLQTDLNRPKDLVKCDRQLLEKLRQLNAAEIKQKTEGQLQEPVIKALITRRDRILSHFQKLIAERGEDAVLY
jgi:hypothetical protein